MLLQPGETFDRYVIEAAIGEGGMGRVYRARDTKLGRLVALKVLGSTPSGVASEGTARMMREARAAAAFDHPNAVSLFDVGEHDGAPFIAMELVEGRSLRAYVGDASVPVPTRLRWVADVARALAAAHRRGLVHRDVKPENVMVRDDGVVKVLDFGIARRSHDGEPGAAAAVTTLTAAGVVVGTPMYMAPEQIRGNSIDGRTDQFSWGVLAYELLAGELPWQLGSTSLSVVAQILTDDPQPLSDRVPDLSSMAAATVMKALSKSPDNRFPSMEDVVSALDPYTSAPSLSPGMFRVSGRAEISAPTMRSTPPAAPPETLQSPDAPPPSKATGEPPSAGPPTVQTPPPSAARQVPADQATRPPSTKAPSTKSPSSRMRQRRRRLSTVAIAVASLGAGFFTMHLLSGRTPATPSPAPSAGPSGATAATPSATAMTDLPPPRSDVPQALVEYREALQAHRDGMDCTGHLRRAIDLDPNLAPAYLRLGILEQQPAPEEASIHLRRASDLRGSLTPRDQAVLDIVQPGFMRHDWQGMQRDFAALRDRFASDAEIASMLGTAAMNAGDARAAAAAFEDAVRLDPRFALADWQLGQALLYAGDFERGRAALDRCLAISPPATDCHWTLNELRESSGDCAGIVADARAWTHADPQSEWAWESLARGLVGIDAPAEGVREAVAQQVKWTAEATRARLDADARVRLAALDGRFDEAESAARALEKQVADSSLESDHAGPAGALAEILRETGRLQDAAREAESFLKRRAGWPGTTLLEDSAIAADPVPMLLETELRAGAIDRATFVARRDAWLADEKSRIQPWAVSYLWMHGAAATVGTADEAREAMALLPAYEPLAPFRPRTVVEAAIGRTYVLAARPDDGLRLLRRAAASCLAFDLPFGWVRAHEWLGEALEAAHDGAGACAAYGVVLARWGKAKPRSVTADAARARAAALHCP